RVVGSPTVGPEPMAAHPVPDENSVAAAEAILSAVYGLSEDDLVIVLLSGGASALLCAPAPGLTLESKRQVTSALLRSGATIQEMNCVRKHLSAIKGGRLAQAAAPARCVTLAISDVVGDDAAAIGSGPTVGDPTTRHEALAIVERYEIDAPDAVRAVLASPGSETPKPGELTALNGDVRIIAAPGRALRAAADAARENGLPSRILGDGFEGLVADVAYAHADAVLNARAGELLLSSGEATVEVRGDGRGGPNMEFCLALALRLEGGPRFSALAVDTDGIDGAAPAAGAYVDDKTLARARGLGLDPEAALARNDSFGFFDALGAVVDTGHTQTNVNDFRAILVAPAG
ncbi:MAG: DUF4147 domain-containing protein, partial [Pseudomonadota bacterium]